MTRFATIVAGCLCLLWVLAGRADAHASLVTSSPKEGAVLAAPPSVLSLTFNEAVTLAPGRTQLYDARGGRIRVEVASVDETVTIRPVERLARGSYIATYALVSADSHPIAGSLAFSVGAPSEQVVPPPAVSVSGHSVLRSIVQGLTYVFLLVAAGLAIFAAWVLPADRPLQALRGKLRWILGNCSMLAAAGALALVPLGAAGLRDAGALALAAMVLVGLALADTVLGDRPPSGRDRLLVTFGALTTLSAPAIVGHTRSFDPALLMLTSDVVHLVAAGVWLGGLVGLAVTLAVLADRDRVAAQVLARFSQLAGGLLALVGLAGVLLGWRILGAWSGLATTYGAILLAKVALVLLVLGLAGWNRYRLLPSVLGGDSAHRLHATVRVEAVVLVAVLIVTGFLGTADPRPASPVAAGSRGVSVDDVRLAAVLGPGTVGPNTIRLRIQDLDGSARDPWGPPSISVVSGGVDLGSRPVRRVGRGRYVARALIPRSGEWQVVVSVRTGQFDTASMTLDATVTG
ncbi:MAG TPA: copper resistance protein CopC [Nocardioidaceae bacterium]|nr:copper resistance protein CopC [Nocardioidaceae bacterium]